MNNENQSKNLESFEISILGRRYIITTDQGGAYVQKAVDYVAKMYDMVKETPGFSKHSKDYQNLMMYLNMADEYLHACQWTEEKQILVNQEAEETIAALRQELEAAQAKAMETEQHLQEDMVHLKKKVERSFYEKNRMQEQVKAAEQKVMSLEKDLAGYRTETSVLKRKMDEMTKNAEEVLRLKKEQATRARDWESKLQQLKSELEDKHAADMEATEVMHRKTVESMNQQKDDSLQKLREEYEKRLIRMQENYEGQIASTKEGYESQISTMKEEYETTVSGMQVASDQKIMKLKEEHENQLGRMKTAHDAKVDRVLAEKANATAPLEETIRKQEEELIELRDQLAESEKKLASLRYKLQEVVGD